MAAAVFLDRDGTIIEDRGHLSSPAQAAFLPGAVSALRRLQEGFLLFIITNQSGVAKGIITAAEAHGVSRHVVEELAREGVVIRETYACIHERGECCCRKPSPFFLQEAARRFDLDLGQSFVVGDHPHDVETARNAGATGLYVLTGHGAKHRAELDPDVRVVPDLAAAAEWIMSQSKERKNA